jgi:hypothetical protein
VSVWLASYLGGWKVSIVAVELALSLVISTALFALVYKYVPQERLHWRDVWVGGAVTAILFNVGKFAIGYYLATSAFASVYPRAPCWCYCCGPITPLKYFSLGPKSPKAIRSFSGHDGLPCPRYRSALAYRRY